MNTRFRSLKFANRAGAPQARLRNREMWQAGGMPPETCHISHLPNQGF